MANFVQVFNNSALKLLPIKQTKEIVDLTLKASKIKYATVNVVYVNDSEITDMNKSFLDHDRPTDVITFSFGEKNIEGEIYISAETAEKQSKEYGVSLREEILRLASHGALHLAGYDDRSDAERKVMNDLESSFIKQIHKKSIKNVRKNS